MDVDASFQSANSTLSDQGFFAGPDLHGVFDNLLGPPDDKEDADAVGRQRTSAVHPKTLPDRDTIACKFSIWIFTTDRWRHRGHVLILLAT